MKLLRQWNLSSMEVLMEAQQHWRRKSDEPNTGAVQQVSEAAAAAPSAEPVVTAAAGAGEPPPDAQAAEAAAKEDDTHLAAEGHTTGQSAAAGLVTTAAAPTADDQQSRAPDVARSTAEIAGNGLADGPDTRQARASVRAAAAVTRGDAAADDRQLGDGAGLGHSCHSALENKTLAAGDGEEAAGPGVAAEQHTQQLIGSNSKSGQHQKC